MDRASMPCEKAARQYKQRLKTNTFSRILSWLESTDLRKFGVKQRCVGRPKTSALTKLSGTFIVVHTHPIYNQKIC
jgi:hypothetical protein